MYDGHHLSADLAALLYGGEDRRGSDEALGPMAGSAVVALTDEGIALSGAQRFDIQEDGNNTSIRLAHTATVLETERDMTWGHDIIEGTEHSDRLSGTRGQDSLYGLDDGDDIYGGKGDDKIVGGRGNDRLNGGKGQDDFIYTAAGDSEPGEGKRDHIEDFIRSDGDRIDLGQIDANVHEDGDQAFDFIGTEALGGSREDAGELRYQVTSTNDTLVQADVNGDGLADFEVLVECTSFRSPPIHLSGGDFVL
ncbi:hypothetical protein KXS07_36420 [Inquilinus limosus]|uniref:calcium-binding protein n=1 Tax=Inquilinus limosus TaxID=171674 RepID=UPI003F1508FE